MDNSEQFFEFKRDIIEILTMIESLIENLTAASNIISDQLKESLSVRIEELEMKIFQDSVKLILGTTFYSVISIYGDQLNVLAST